MNTTATATVSEKHPKGLYTLFFTEMWERFSYYGMRALLVLYLTNEAMRGGFGMERANALEIYAMFTGLVYLTPILGGLLADKILGQRKAIYIGGLLMALGQFTLAASVTYGEVEVASREFFLNAGLGLLIMGNGFFKPNISTIVGALYDSNDPRKDSAFTIFYMGINLGAFLSPLICGTLGEKVGWEYGFASAGLGMLFGLVWFFSRANSLDGAGFPPGRKGEALRLATRDYIEVVLYVLVNIGLVLGFLTGWEKMTEDSQSILVSIITVVAIVGLAWTIITGTKGKDEWSKV